MFVRHNLPTSWKPPLSPETWESLLELHPGTICGNSSFMTGLDISAALGRVWLLHTKEDPETTGLGRCWIPPVRSCSLQRSTLSWLWQIAQCQQHSCAVLCCFFSPQAAAVCPQIQEMFYPEAEKWEMHVGVTQNGLCVLKMFSWARFPGTFLLLQLLPRLPACIPGGWEWLAGLCF